MSEPKSDFLRLIVERGYLHQCTDLDALDEKILNGRISAYVGYDATGDSLHVGHLVSIMMLYWMQHFGHQPITLMGGGTTKVGDPSGKDETRKMLTDDDITGNIASIRRTFENVLTYGENDAIMVNNADWLDKLEYISFLRDVGPHFTINRMLTFDSVKLRLDREQPLTFLEFNYMILQAYDFMELSRRHGCVLQMGGSDQWGNIVNGVELTRRITAKQVFGLTTPLITTASGAKMGKTAAGAVWLNEDRLSSFDYWQFWRNTEDADVSRFLKLFTLLPMDEIDRLSKLEGQELNEAKKVLATEATAVIRGRAAAEEAAETARKTFEEGQSAEGLPTVDVPAADLTAGIPAFSLFQIAGLASSGGEARRLVRGGGARLNDIQITDENQNIGMESATQDGAIKLSAGKKRHILIRPA
ncbi:tyrosine--tRNA ligase [Alphaproteobacteria bacterium HT1-32]|nr:tyrosine--tRNA ligase [Alphaproteobacteria bacterium HT1-32]